ncbi:MAG: carboxypeptidase M32 [Myxococcaceae bacterium]|nr:carboxypeptidase M32 [Myxococcaceae bacterium]
MNASFEMLIGRMQELKDLGGLIGLATWDQQTYLPKKAGTARAEQLSTLQGLYHERLVDPRLGEWLEAVTPADADGKSMIRVLKLERDRAVKLPARLVKELATAQAHGLSAWLAAREANDFAPFKPALETLLQLRREQADAWGHDGERYDALLETYEPGMRVARLSPVLKALTQKLVPVVQTILERPVPDSAVAGKRFDGNAQWDFTLQLLKAMGFDLAAGRQDKSVHPFSGGTHPLDVRLTTRVNETTPMPAIFGTIHEGGHGLYEQGFAESHYRTPLACAPSMGLHESQSRLWENMVGRSRGYWRYFYPLLQVKFPAELKDASADAFYATVNTVSRSLIRVESDELTYNLHIVLRYELELELVRGNLSVADLPHAWNEKTFELLGLRPSHPVEGVLQDIHWSGGDIGYFPTYALGNLYAASLWKTAREQLPGLEADIARGQLLGLRDWLREKVHRQGFRYFAEDLVKHVTGRGLTDEDFMAHVKAKYGELYGVSL